MDKFNNYNYDNNYIKQIKKSNYLQTINDNKINQHKLNINSDKLKQSDNKPYQFLFDCILYTNDYNSLLNNNKNYIDSTKIKLASLLDEDSKKFYDKFNYSKHVKKKIIQNNIQKNNYLSSIIYLSDFYKKSIYLIYNKQLIVVTDKYDDIQFFNFNNGWLIDKTPDINKTKKIDTKNSNILETLFNDDLNKNYYYYNYGLSNINKYKLCDLQTLAVKNNISINSNGKNKLKKILYDELYNLKTMLKLE